MTTPEFKPEPKLSVFLSAEWRSLLMVNYAIDPAILRDRIPAGTELDFHEGKTFVSMVGFRFLNTKVMGMALPFHRNFDEVNLRFYIRHKHGNDWRRGVCFVREIVPKSLIAWVARTIYNEPYIAAPMTSMVDTFDATQTNHVDYRWTLGKREHRLAATYTGEPTIPADDSEPSFIIEHYWGYNRQKNGSTMEYGVEHPKWRVWPGENAVFDSDIAGLYGSEFVETLRQPPTSVVVAEGSAVVVRKGRRV